MIEVKDVSERQTLVRQMRSILAERLFCDVEQVTLQSRLIGDLGVDSLDFIDLQFVLEARLGIQFQQGEFFDVTLEWVTKDGYVKPNALERFAELWPELKDTPADIPLPLKSLLERVTVETLVLIVEKAQETGRSKTGC